MDNAAPCTVLAALPQNGKAQMATRAYAASDIYFFDYGLRQSLNDYPRGFAMSLATCRASRRFTRVIVAAQNAADCPVRTVTIILTESSEDIFTSRQ